MKNDQPEPLNLRWLADGDVTDKLDGQGFLKEQPKRDSAPLTEYEKLLDGLFLCSKIFGEREALHSFAAVLEANGHAAAAHQIRAGLKDAGRISRDAHQNWPACLGCGAEPGDMHHLNCQSTDRVQNPPPPDHTPQEPFTEEEIAKVRTMTHIRGESFATLAAGLKNGTTGIFDSKEMQHRLAACAEHLSKMEG